MEDSVARAREAIRLDGAAAYIDDLRESDLGQLGWSGDRLHLDAVAKELGRTASGDAAYLVVRIDGVPYAKAGIDFARDPAVGFVWQVATHPSLRRLGLASALMGVAEERIARRGRGRARLAVETDNVEAERLYRRLGYDVVGTDTESWPTVDESGTEELYVTEVVVMEKVLGAPS